jgi:hypothetical protein
LPGGQGTEPSPTWPKPPRTALTGLENPRASSPGGTRAPNHPSSGAARPAGKARATPVLAPIRREWARTSPPVPSTRVSSVVGALEGVLLQHGERRARGVGQGRPDVAAHGAHTEHHGRVHLQEAWPGGDGGIVEAFRTRGLGYEYRRTLLILKVQGTTGGVVVRPPAATPPVVHPTRWSIRRPPQWPVDPTQWRHMAKGPPGRLVAGSDSITLSGAWPSAAPADTRTSTPTAATQESKRVEGHFRVTLARAVKAIRGVLSGLSLPATPLPCSTWWCRGERRCVRQFSRGGAACAPVSCHDHTSTPRSEGHSRGAPLRMMEAITLPDGSTCITPPLQSEMDNQHTTCESVPIVRNSLNGGG